MGLSRPTLGFQQYVLSIILILAISIACSAAGTPSTPQTVQSLGQLAAPLGTGWVVGDLDGDQKVDLAVSRDIARTANGYQYRVELKLTHKTGSLTFSHSDGLGVTIAAIDVDGDHDLDLVIDGRFPGQRIGIWINDGKGTFTEDLQHRFTSPDSASMLSLRPDIPAQAIDDSFNPIPAFVFAEAFFPFHLIESGPIGCTAVPAIARIARGTKHLRAPPQASL